jgi:hypothetical protein
MNPYLWILYRTGGIVKVEMLYDRNTQDGIFVKITALPYRIHGYSRMNMDGSYTIFLNAHDSIERQEESKRHEVEHIYKGDYDNCGVLVDAVERARHEG